MTRALFLTLLTTLLLVAVSGCSNHDDNEWERLVCEVEVINGGEPLLSAYADVGNDNTPGTEDDVLPIDWVPVTFRARPYSSAIYLPEDGPQSWFHVTSYDLVWHPIADAPAGLTDHNIVGGLCDAVVPVGDDATVSVLIADRVLKEEPWFRDLLIDSTHSFTANCELTFHGHETGNSRQVDIPAGLVVTFFGYISED